MSDENNQNGGENGEENSDDFRCMGCEVKLEVHELFVCESTEHKNGFLHIGPLCSDCLNSHRIIFHGYVANNWANN